MSLSRPQHALREALERVNLVKRYIEDEGKDGLTLDYIMAAMQCNFGIAPRKTREYLSSLLIFGKITKEGDRYYPMIDGRTEERSQTG